MRQIPAHHPRTSTPILYCTEEINEAQMGVELTQDCTASTFITEIVRMATSPEVSVEA